MDFITEVLGFISSCFELSFSFQKLKERYPAMKKMNSFLFFILLVSVVTLLLLVILIIISFLTR